MSTVIKELVVGGQEKRREKIMNYASPKILLKSLSLHGAFPRGGGGGGMGDGGVNSLGSGSVANSIKVSPRYGALCGSQRLPVMRDRTLYAIMYDMMIWWHTGPCLKFHALSNSEVLIADAG